MDVRFLPKTTWLQKWLHTGQSLLYKALLDSHIMNSLQFKSSYLEYKFLLQHGLKPRGGYIIMEILVMIRIEEVINW